MLTIDDAQKIMGKNFIGSEELAKMDKFLKVKIAKVPPMPFSAGLLKKQCKDYILILGVAKDAKGRAITINNLRMIFGVDPARSEPCFYNQDWYLKEKFAAQTTLKLRWYLVGKNIISASRDLEPKKALANLPKNVSFPSAILMAYTFFAYYLAHGGEILWKNDFIWCSDLDHNGDRIYIGRYIDPNGINKNGFNIHRHLSIRPCYGVIAAFI